MTVKELVDYMKKYEIRLFYRREEMLKQRKIIPSPNRKRIRLSLAGLDIYLCGSAREKIAKDAPVLRKRTSRACGCKTRFTIQFPHGYKHALNNEINVGDHGNESVKVTWAWKHNHDFNDPNLFAELPLSGEARSLLRSAVLDFGVTWFQIHQMQTKLRESDHMGPCELLKIKDRHLRYIMRESSLNQPFSSTPVVTRFDILANVIQSSGGFAEYSTKFRCLPGNRNHGSEDLNNSKNREVWSFCFMSAWQRDVLRQNPRWFHVDSTHKTCFGLRNDDEDAYLFTICVKTQKTGSVAPCAFMLSNAITAPVIADFLYKVHVFTGVIPSQAAIDCDEAGTALRAVWGPFIPIIYCRFHLEKAFREQLDQKIQPSANKEDIKTEIHHDFQRVLASRNDSEAHHNIFWFLKKHEVHAEFVSYVNQHWFARRDFIIEGCNPRYVRGENTHSLLEPFHSLLKLLKHVRERCDRRPDAWAHSLFTFVAPSFMGKAKEAESGFTHRVHIKAEALAKDEAMEIPNEEVEKRVFLSGEGQLTVHSFTNGKTLYSVHLEAAGREKNTCTCPWHCDSGSLCKHIFLAERFWKAKSSPQTNIPEISHDGDSSSMDSKSLQVKKAAASANDTSNSESLSSSEETLVSHLDCTSQGPEDVSHQSPDFMAAQSTMATDVDTDDDVAEIGSNMAFDRKFEEIIQALAVEVKWDISIVKHGPSGSIELAHTTKETEEERQIRLSHQGLLELVKDIYRLYCEAPSEEEKLRLVDFFDRVSTKVFLELTESDTEQEKKG
ncbi:hypothetical protein METSCH_D05200 [Metschnikowia aff. pulcherrima]|uniref:SWIM-type domain-containing protein n=1 Tax=Metschnikowia aff. pulcherrima TaxID=2163413 RepID=A0A4P6XTH5_9ASCO|nr:hypothetical protein METSCH_D05200 [Metschnikowia aff. pulcherrima]